MQWNLTFGQKLLWCAGVVTSKVDFDAQKVTVEGAVNRQDVLRRIRKTGKRAKLIPGPNDAADPPAEEKKEEIKEEKKGTKKVHPFMTYYPYKLLAQYCCRCLPKKSAPAAVPVPPPA